MEIRGHEAELNRLRQQETKLGRFTRPAGPSGPALQPRGRARGRINWSNVLVRLPKEFSASNVRAVPGIKRKRPSEIFAAITRWIEAGSVRRKARGEYEKV